MVGSDLPSGPRKERKYLDIVVWVLFAVVVSLILIGIIIK